ncbi:MAG: hypothetical protein KF817_01705 [Phycisphaeraceae bacterium]|nr:hypothetical protein [Phycisphaeraceae bacterium]
MNPCIRVIRRPTCRAAGLAIPVLLLFAAWTGPTARGQGYEPPRMVQEALLPDIVRGDLQAMRHLLELTEEQVPVIELLFDDYTRRFTEGRRDLMRRIAEIRPAAGAGDADHDQVARLEAQIGATIADLRRRLARSEDPIEQARLQEEIEERLAELREAIAEIGPAPARDAELRDALAAMERIAAEWAVQKRALRDRFMHEVRVTLTEAQRAKWPDVERRIRRERGLIHGRLAGESLDLLALAARLPVPERRRDVVTSLLETYERRLDGALSARQQAIEAFPAAVAAARGAGRADEVRRVAYRLADAHRGVRDVQLESFAAFVDQLEPEAAAEAHRIFGELVFPRVVRPTAAQRVMDGVRRHFAGAEAVDPAITRILEQYESGRRDLDALLKARIIEQEPAALAEGLAAGGAPGDSEGVRSAFASRRAFEQDLLEALRQVLPADAVRSLGPLLGGARGGTTPDQGGGLVPRTDEERALFRRFDADGDGRLDEAEEARLRAYIRERESRGAGGA